MTNPEMVNPVDFTISPLERIKRELAEYGQISDSSYGSHILIRCHSRVRPHFEILEVAARISKRLTDLNISHSVSVQSRTIQFAWEL